MAHIKDDFDIRDYSIKVVFQDTKQFPELKNEEDTQVWEVNPSVRVTRENARPGYKYTATGAFECVEELMREVANFFTAYEIEAEAVELEDYSEAAQEAYELSCADMYAVEEY